MISISNQEFINTSSLISLLNMIGSCSEVEAIKDYGAQNLISAVKQIAFIPQKYIRRLFVSNLLFDKAVSFSTRPRAK